jgi:quinol monooxygenase YgiN
MAYVVCARWTAKQGEEERVLAAIKELTPLSRGEPGCLYYQPTRDPADPRVFFIFEIYEDEDGYAAHGASEHFQRLGLGEAIPLLEGRERTFYETVDV